MALAIWVVVIVWPENDSSRKIIWRMGLRARCRPGPLGSDSNPRSPVRERRTGQLHTERGLAQSMAARDGPTWSHVLSWLTNKASFWEKPTKNAAFRKKDTCVKWFTSVLDTGVYIPERCG